MELQNIKYQTMLLNGNSKVVSNKQDSSNITEFLNKEKEINKDKPWSKLGKHIKTKLLFAYIDTFSKDNGCSEIEKLNLKKYIALCLERKKLTRVKDVSYDSKKGVIKSIPGLIFDKTKQKFTLRRPDKKKTTLKSIAPKSKKNKPKKPKTGPKKDKKNKIDIKN